MMATGLDPGLESLWQHPVQTVVEPSEGREQPEFRRVTRHKESLNAFVHEAFDHRPSVARSSSRCNAERWPRGSIWCLVAT